MLQDFTVRRQLRHDDLTRNVRHTAVVLIEKGLQNAGASLVDGSCHVHAVSLTADEFAVADRENCERICNSFVGRVVLRNTHDDIRFIGVMQNHPLCLAQRLGRFNVVAVLGSRLVVHLVGGFFHALFQSVHQWRRVPPQELDCPRHSLFVFVMRHAAGADAPALVDMIVEARTESLRESYSAAPLQGEAGIEQVDDPVHSSRVAIGAEVAAAVFAHLPGLDNPRPFLFCYFYIWIGFVVPQENVVLRPVLLNEIALQNERLHLTVHGDILELTDLADHAPDLRVHISGRLEVLPHTAAQANSLANVDYIAKAVFVDINSRGVRKLFESFFNVFRNAHLFL